MHRLALPARRFVLPLLCMVAGCQPPTSGGPRHRASLQNDFVVPKSSLVEVGREEQALTSGDGPAGQQVLYLNFDGATLTVVANPGDDAPTNQSWIPNVGGSTVVFPPFDTSPYTGSGSTYTDASAKAKIVTDVTNWYSAYNVYVVTTRPSSGRYTMMLIGGITSSFVSGAPDAVGIASLDCGNSSQNNIGFAFAGSINADDPVMGTTAQQNQIRDTNLLLVAQTCAHEAGHTFGLEHVNNVHDIMDPSVDPSVTGFLSGGNALSAGSQCGRSGGTQDDNADLLSNLGPNPGGSTVIAKPAVAWLAPKSGDTVPEQFILQVSASEPSGAGGTITKIDIVQQGSILTTFTTPPYAASFDTQGQTGTFTLSAVATNSLGGTASADTTFTISASAPAQGPIGCLVNVDCMSGQICSNNDCVGTPTPTCNPPCGSGEVCQFNGTCSSASTPDMASGGDGGTVLMNPTAVPVGQACTTSSTCGTNGVCAQAGSTMYCTETCDPAVATSCPTDFACVAAGGAHYCAPKATGGSGCDMGGGAQAASSSLLGMLLLGFFGFALRRRPSAT